MWLRLLGVAAVMLSGAIPRAEAQGVTAVIDRDIRVFTVVSALNAAGFDIELAPQYHPVREAVRERLNGLDAGLRERLREYYRQRKGDGSDEDQLAKYLSLALNLTGPPDFEFAYLLDFIPPDAREVQGFAPLLRDFFAAAEISRLWAALDEYYEADLTLLSAPLRDVIFRSDVYLRVPPGGSGARQLVILRELTAPVNSVHVRNYSDNLYMVLGPSASAPVNDVRHAYLHVLLDPIVAGARADLAGLEALGGWLQGVDGVRAQYTQNFDIMVGESLIRAAELRMDGLTPENASGMLERAYRSGLLLAPRFFELFEGFEASEEGMRAYFPSMVRSVQLAQERERFDTRFAAIPPVIEEPSRAEVPAPPDPILPLLSFAQEAFNSGEDEAAETAFTRVLEELDPENGPALYGLALIASRREDPDSAREYFQRTIESGSAEPGMTVWSHIYLGRLYDLDCEREEAVAQYQRAIEAGDDTRNAQAAARAGLTEPFGGACF